MAIVPGFQVIDPTKKYVPCVCGNSQMAVFQAGDLFYKVVDGGKSIIYGIEHPAQAAMCTKCGKIRTNQDLMAEAVAKEAVAGGTSPHAPQGP